jgi:hypothetical protein
MLPEIGTYSFIYTLFQHLSQQLEEFLLFVLAFMSLYFITGIYITFQLLIFLIGLTRADLKKGISQESHNCQEK